MKSMTGYGYREYQDSKLILSVEIKAYNNRYLDMAVMLPSFLSPLELGLRDFIRTRVYRGRIELNVRVKELEENLQAYLDKSAAAEYAKTLLELRETAHIKEPLSVSHFLSLEGVIKTEKKRDPDYFEKLIYPLLEDAWNDCDESRTREGLYTAEHIARNIEVLKQECGEVEKHAGNLETNMKEHIMTRYRAILSEEIDENRMLSETALLLMKYGIGEEISRLQGHWVEFSRVLSAGTDGPVGKRLDFLCQEMNREINTIGSKSTIIEINQAVVRMKEALENIREQLRNVE